MCCSGRRTYVGVFESGVLRGIFGVAAVGEGHSLGCLRKVC